MRIRINVASKNNVKIDAVREVAALYGMLKNSEICSIDVKSGVSEQPKSLDETVRGAINRANAAYTDCTYSVGIESGIMYVPHTKTGFMEFSACVVYNGKEYGIGLSSAFEFPVNITKMIHKLGLDANEAFFNSGLTKDNKIGSSDGAVGLLTKGRVTRKDYTKQALIMALINFENPDLYGLK